VDLRRRSSGETGRTPTHAATGILICADAATCHDIQGQAALLTATATAARAFGNVVVFVTTPDTVIAAGRMLASAIVQQGARLADPADTGSIRSTWPILLIGQDTPVPSQVTGPVAKTRPALRAAWAG